MWNEIKNTPIYGMVFSALMVMVIGFFTLHGFQDFLKNNWKEYYWEILLVLCIWIAYSFIFHLKLLNQKRIIKKRIKANEDMIRPPLPEGEERNRDIEAAQNLELLYIEAGAAIKQDRMALEFTELYLLNKKNAIQRLSAQIFFYAAETERMKANVDSHTKRMKDLTYFFGCLEYKDSQIILNLQKLESYNNIKHRGDLRYKRDLTEMAINGLVSSLNSNGDIFDLIKELARINKMKQDAKLI